MTYINPEFRARQLGQSSPRQITGSVEPPIEAQTRDVTPHRRRFSWPALAALWGVAGVTVGLAIGRALWF